MAKQYDLGRVVGEAPIDDAAPSSTKVYSSQKTQNELDQLSEQKANKSGWTANKIIGTDANGNLVAQDPPKSESNPLDKFEIGVIYHFAVNVNPPEKYGGEWEKINGRILIGTGTPEANSLDGKSPGDYDYALGSTGGEAENTLTADEMPSHDHAIASSFNTDYAVAWPAWTFYPSGDIYTQKGETVMRNPMYTSKSGGGAAHNNMPPWEAVNMWKRVS